MRKSGIPILFLFWITSAYARKPKTVDDIGSTKINERCFSNEDCPDNSECIVSKCSSYTTCVCKKNTFPSENRNGCYKVSDGTSCDDNTRCPWGSQCEDSVCQCKDGYVKPVADSKHCVYKLLAQPKNDATMKFALYGDKCDMNRVCISERGDVHCDKTSKSCSCKPGHRPAELGEINTAQFPVGCVFDTEAESC